jgi:hypothetical protein
VRIHMISTLMLASALFVPISTAAHVTEAAATPTVGGYFSSDVHSCGSFKLFVPNASQFAAHQTGFSRQSIGLRQTALSRMHGRTIHWLTSLTCKQGPVHHPLTTVKHSIASPAVTGFTPNWSGYVYNDSVPMGVTQDWQQPILSDANNGAFVDSTIWPGLGGFNGSQVLVQGGTDIAGSCSDSAGCSYSEGSPFFWVEALPDNPTEVIVSGLPVNLDDDVSSTVDFNYSTDTAEIQLCNNTLGECADLSKVMNNGEVPGPTVEWIAERGDFSGTYPELNDFGGLNIDIAEWEDTGGQAQAVTGDSYAMRTCDGTTILATPGPVGSYTDGPYFNDQFNNLGHPDPQNCG